MTRGDADNYYPCAVDDRTQKTKIIIKTEDGGKETVNYKLRDRWALKVGYGLELHDIIFNAIDSQCDTCTDPLAATNTCTNTGSSLGGGCTYTRTPTEYCPGGMTTGTFIEFDLTKDTALWNRQLLTIDNCEFHNFLYEMNSFIQLHQYGARITITNSKFEHFSFCGSFITTREMYFYERTDLNTNDDEEHYLIRANNYQKELFETYKYDGISGLDPFNGDCNTGIGDTTDLCFDLEIENTEFNYFGAHKETIDEPMFVDPALG